MTNETMNIHWPTLLCTLAQGLLYLFALNGAIWFACVFIGVDTSDCVARITNFFSTLLMGVLVMAKVE